MVVGSSVVKMLVAALATGGLALALVLGQGSGGKPSIPDPAGIGPLRVTLPNPVPPSETSSSSMGTSVAFADLDRDGSPEALIGDCLFFRAGNPYGGGVHVFEVPGFSYARTIQPPPFGLPLATLMGATVATGDIDGDRIPEVAVSAVSAAIRPQLWVYFDGRS